MNHQRSGAIKNLLRFARHITRATPKYFGNRLIECTCGRKSRFLAVGSPPRYDALCRYCGSYERHRLMLLWLRSNSEVLTNRRVLHFAPEEQIESVLREHTEDYIAAHYSPVKGGIDIENLQDFKDCSLDLIICSHVLEHVNDRAALSEINRVLTPQGVALLMFPVIEGWDKTLEEADFPKQLLTPKERELYFGQSDHIRYFGRDVRQRIQEAGFTLEEFTAVEPLVSTYGLTRGEKLFIAKKIGRK